MTEPSRFAFYLVPPYQIARDIAEIHSMLEKQFGFSAANKFQVHCTIKGFFKKNDKPLETLLAGLDTFMEGQRAFDVEFNGFRTKPMLTFLTVAYRRKFHRAVDVLPDILV